MAGACGPVDGDGNFEMTRAAVQAQMQFAATGSDRLLMCRTEALTVMESIEQANSLQCLPPAARWIVN